MFLPKDCHPNVLRDVEAVYHLLSRKRMQIINRKRNASLFKNNILQILQVLLNRITFETHEF